MMRRSPLPILCALAITACTSPGGPYPSLAPRAAERIDPRLPVGPLSAAQPASAALEAQLAALVAQAREGDRQFGPAIAEAQRLAGQAGAAQGESWISAQQALSAATAARAPTTRALGDIDGIAARQLQQQQTLSPADLAAVQRAQAIAGEIDRAQHARIEAVSRTLGL